MLDVISRLIPPLKRLNLYKFCHMIKEHDFPLRPHLTIHLWLKNLLRCVKFNYENNDMKEFKLVLPSQTSSRRDKTPKKKKDKKKDEKRHREKG